jgi:hypothetical protein
MQSFRDVVFELNEGQSNQEAEVAWWQLGRSRWKWLQPEFLGGPIFQM